jgi:hypothetical protein
MPVIKRVLCPQRLRRVPSQFSWIDHRLVRHRHIARCSHSALALYLFLVAVGDGEGLSYWSDASICRLLRFEPVALARARQELISAELIAYRPPLYQVLALEDPEARLPFVPRPAATASPQGSGPTPTTPRTSHEQPRESAEQPQSLGQVLRQIMEQVP